MEPQFSNLTFPKKKLLENQFVQKSNLLCHLRDVSGHTSFTMKGVLGGKSKTEVLLDNQDIFSITTWLKVELFQNWDVWVKIWVYFEFKSLIWYGLYGFNPILWVSFWFLNGTLLQVDIQFSQYHLKRTFLPCHWIVFGNLVKNHYKCKGLFLHSISSH